MHQQLSSAISTMPQLSAAVHLLTAGMLMFYPLASEAANSSFRGAAVDNQEHRQLNVCAGLKNKQCDAPTCTWFKGGCIEVAVTPEPTPVSLIFFSIFVMYILGNILHNI